MRPETLQLAIEGSIEIATHICSADNLGVPSSYAEAFQLLADAGVVPCEVAAQLRRMAQFRNRIVHLYWDVDPEQVYRMLQNELGDFGEYPVHIERYLG
jgi:uncharacterized protein YutE (UPF0331/DUF86 family)